MPSGGGVKEVASGMDDEAEFSDSVKVDNRSGTDMASALFSSKGYECNFISELRCGEVLETSLWWAIFPGSGTIPSRTGGNSTLEETFTITILENIPLHILVRVKVAHICRDQAMFNGNGQR